MADRHYDSKAGEFVDFKTLACWEKNDKVKTAGIATLKAENERLREALIFYEDPWGAQLNEGCTPSEVQVPDFYDEMDFGARARAALEGG